MPMPLFPFTLPRARTVAGMKPPEPPKIGGTEQVRSSSGLGGIFSRKNLPRTLGVIGAGLRQMGGEPEVLDNYLANEARQQALNLAMSRQSTSDKREEEQRRLIEAAISQLPPEQQAWARMNPEAFAEAWASRQANGGWQHGQGYSHLWRPNPDGTVTLGDELPLRPRAPIMGYMMPDDDGTYYTDELPPELRDQ